MEKNRKPGVMLYFDTLMPLRQLDDEDLGMMFTAILEYAQHKIEPNFGAPMCYMWPYVKINIDRDEERYYVRCSQGRYGNYIRYLPEGETPISFEEWRQAEREAGIA